MAGPTARARVSVPGDCDGAVRSSFISVLSDLSDKLRAQGNHGGIIQSPALKNAIGMIVATGGWFKEATIA